MPPLTLEGLTSIEANLQGIVASISGTIEERIARFREESVFHRYSELFLSYLALAEPPSSNVEALKRAVFLAWYELSEPTFLSGVGDVPEDARRRLVALLDSLGVRLDDEFRWMLAWYFHLSDFAFPDLDSHPDLKVILRSEDPMGWIRHRHTSDRMRGRGLMGEYWISVFGSSAA